MNEQEFKDKTKKLGLRVIRLVQALPSDYTAQTIGRQILRCATSVGANYRAACRAKSEADMAAKLAIVEEEADETLYWLELLGEAEIFPKSRLADLMRETEQILAMVVSSRKTIRSGMTYSSRKTIREEQDSYEAEEVQSKIENQKSKIIEGDF